MRGKDAISQERQTINCAADLAFGWMQSQSQGLQKSLDLNPPIGQFSFVIGKQNEIVAIPDIGRTPQDILNEVIERIQHDVPEELAR